MEPARPGAGGRVRSMWLVADNVTCITRKTWNIAATTNGYINHHYYYIIIIHIIVYAANISSVFVEQIKEMRKDAHKSINILLLHHRTDVKLSYISSVISKNKQYITCVKYTKQANTREPNNI